MKFILIGISTFISFFGNANASEATLSEIIVKPSGLKTPSIGPAAKDTLKLYIPTDLLKELLEEGRVFSSDSVESMNCGGNDCSISE